MASAAALAATSVLLVLSLVPGAPAPAADGGPFRLDGDVERGAALYPKKCKGCHGPEGRGDGALAKSLDPPPGDLTDGERMARWSDEELYRLIRDGGEAAGLSAQMPAWGKLLSDPEVRDVAAFVRALAAEP